MKASIIILNHNGMFYLDACLSSLFRQTFKDFEVIVFDNGSTDGSSQYIWDNYPQIYLIPSSVNLGFAEGNNEAVKFSSSEYVILLNNDTYLDAKWLENLISAVESTGADIAAPKILKLTNPAVIDSAGIEFDGKTFPRLRGSGEKDIGQYNIQKYIWGASGCSMLIRRTVIDKIGLFDSSYIAYCEDIDFCWRANKAGMKCLYVPKSICYHYGGGTSRRGLDIVSLIEVNKAKTIKKHGCRRVKLNFLISEVLTIIRSEIGNFTKQNTVGAKPYLKAIFEVIR